MGTNRSLVLQLMLIAPCFGAFINTAHAETIVGRWCDIMVPGKAEYYAIKEIVITDDGNIELRSQYGDGSKGIERLVKQDSRHYLTLNRHGEKYRIIPDSGNLELAGPDGPFRVATRLANTPQDGECEM